MTPSRIVLRNLAQRRLASVLTGLSVALGTALVVAILLVERQGRTRFDQAAFGYELIVGARGSAVQLVLNTVYHLDRSPGNIPAGVLEELRADRRVRLAAPIAVGDTYRGFRVVGTSAEFLRELEVVPGRRPADGIDGRVFGDPGAFEAVVGATSARRTGLAVGSRFSPAHGLEEEGPDHHEGWEVVGVLAPTGTPADRAIYVTLGSFMAIAGHEAGAGQLSAVVVAVREPRHMPMLEGELSARPGLMAVGPARVVGDLLAQVAPVGPLMLAIAAMVVGVAAISIMVSITNSMSERRREIAVLRALGARRSTIVGMVLAEAALICLAGGAAGIVLGHLLAAAAGPALEAASGLELAAWEFSALEAGILGALALLGTLSGVLPAMRAYRVEVADGLG